MSSSFRRLAKDHAALRRALPPNYLFEDSHAGISLPDDLTQLIIYITGADGTPYREGLWQLHLKMPTDYPKNPPKATFKTRIFHPNVEEQSGAVCLETLKRDWDPKLTLKDILITISCLLIHPNPDSALNAKAGALIQEDYEGFARQARLMTSIHAPIPKHMKKLVTAARLRGEDVEAQLSGSVCEGEALTAAAKLVEPTNESKENTSIPGSDVQRSKTVDLKASLPRKRSLCEMSPPRDIEITNAEHFQGILPVAQAEPLTTAIERPRKSPKHVHHTAETGVEPAIEDANKENYSSVSDSSEHHQRVTNISKHTGTNRIPNRAALSKMPNSSSGQTRSQARVGIRRL